MLRLKPEGRGSLLVTHYELRVMSEQPVVLKRELTAFYGAGSTRRSIRKSPITAPASFLPITVDREVG